jgi:hypothetical protein
MDNKFNRGHRGRDRMAVRLSTISAITNAVVSSNHVYNQSTITISNLGWLAYVVYRRFPQYFSYIVAVTFIGGGNRSNQRIPPTCRRSLTNFITYCCIK